MRKNAPFLLFYSLQKNINIIWAYPQKNDRGTDHVEVAVSVFTEGVCVRSV